MELKERASWHYWYNMPSPEKNLKREQTVDDLLADLGCILPGTPQDKERTARQEAFKAECRARELDELGDDLSL